MQARTEANHGTDEEEQFTFLATCSASWAGGTDGLGEVEVRGRAEQKLEVKAAAGLIIRFYLFCRGTSSGC